MQVLAPIVLVTRRVLIFLSLGPPGLVEDAEDTAWFLRKAKKGIVRLEDMGKCQDEDSCQLGAHQVSTLTD